MTEKNNVPAVDDIPAEQQTEPTKLKRTNEEKLQELYAKRDKLLKRLEDVKAQEK